MSDEFDFDGKSSKPRGGMQVWDMLSLLMLLATGGLVLYFGLIFINPSSKALKLSAPAIGLTAADSDSHDHGDPT